MSEGFPPYDLTLRCQKCGQDVPIDLSKAEYTNPITGETIDVPKTPVGITLTEHEGCTG